MLSLDITFCNGESTEHVICSRRDTCTLYLMLVRLLSTAKTSPISVTSAPDDPDQCVYYYRVDPNWGL
jgi:hypothetical protein